PARAQGHRQGADARRRPDAAAGSDGLHHRLPVRAVVTTDVTTDFGADLAHDRGADLAADIAGRWRDDDQLPEPAGSALAYCRSVSPLYAGASIRFSTLSSQ